MADYGIKVSKPGYDVADATDEQLVFSSKFDTLKILMVGEGTVPSPWDSGEEQYAVIDLTGLSLGYVPCFVVYTEIEGGADGAFYLAPYTYPAGGDSSIMPFMTEEGLSIRFGYQSRGPSADYAFDYKYIIYQNILYQY